MNESFQYELLYVWRDMLSKSFGLSGKVSDAVKDANEAAAQYKLFLKQVEDQFNNENNEGF